MEFPSVRYPNWHDYWLFRSCIVYVGKGTNARRDMHFKDTKLVYIGELDPAMVSGQVVFVSTCWKNGGAILNIQFESLCVVSLCVVRQQLLRLLDSRTWKTRIWDPSMGR